MAKLEKLLSSSHAYADIIHKKMELQMAATLGSANGKRKAGDADEASVRQLSPLLPLLPSRMKRYFSSPQKSPSRICTALSRLL